MQETYADLVVIGAGPAGLAAAVAAAESGVGRIILIDRLDETGGILQQCIHNGFGLRYFKEELTGPEYAQRFSDLVLAHPNIQIKTETMVLELTRDRRVVAISPGEGLVVYRAGAVVLAMGCRERPRGAINTPGSRPAGVYTAGTIQRLMNIEGYRPGTKAVILGSGDIGLIMARRLTLEGIEVRAVLELMPYSSGLTRNVVQCLNDFGIPLHLSHTVTRIIGEERVEAIEVAPVGGNLRPVLDQAFTIDCDTLVLSVGLIPENELSLQAGVEIDPATGGPRVDSSYQTTTDGIFACGNVVHVHDLVDDVSEESILAGRAAASYLRGTRPEGRRIKIEAGRNIRSVVPQEVLADRSTTLYIRARFPEKEAILHAAGERKTERMITPGETIRLTIRPEWLNGVEDALKVSLEERGEADA